MSFFFLVQAENLSGPGEGGLDSSPSCPALESPRRSLDDSDAAAGGVLEIPPFGGGTEPPGLEIPPFRGGPGRLGFSVDDESGPYAAAGAGHPDLAHELHLFYDLHPIAEAANSSEEQTSSDEEGDDGTEHTGDAPGTDEEKADDDASAGGGGGGGEDGEEEEFGANQGLRRSLSLTELREAAEALSPCGSHEESPLHFGGSAAGSADGRLSRESPRDSRERMGSGDELGSARNSLDSDE